MATVLKLMYKCYHGLMDYYTDPRTKNFFLAQSPLIPIGITFLYFKYVTKWGPNFMKDRKPFNLNKILLIYNLLQIVLSVRFFYIGAMYAFVFGSYKISCEPVDYSNSHIGLLAASETHNYYLIKIFDLLDTVFFVLRKKQKQITFLHLYHHLGMVLMVWIGVRFVPGGHVLFLGFVNSFVHAVMYAYYLAATFNNSSKVWWKKYVTLLQIFQFTIIVLQWLAMVFSPYCGFPKITAILFLPQNIFVLVMFLDFYYKEYIKT